MLGRKFVPGFRVQVEDDDEENVGNGAEAFPADQQSLPVEAAEVPEQTVIRVGQRQRQASSEDEDSSDSLSDVETEDSEEYESFTSECQFVPNKDSI